jgi:acetyl-CoA C-acetyltransferase
MKPYGRKVAIVGANRIPFARSNTAYAKLSNQGMLTDTLRGLVEQYKLQGELLGEVAGGAVLKHSRDWNMVRECVLSSGLSPYTPAYDIQQACGTGLEATILVANKIALGQIESGIACGSDTTSDAPIAVNRGMQRAMMEVNGARTNGAKLKAALKLLNPKFLVPEIPSNSEPRTRKSMGQHAEITAKRMGITRQAQDELALASHKNLAKAYDAGFFDDLVMPYQGLKRDNNLRADSTLDPDRWCLGGVAGLRGLGQGQGLADPRLLLLCRDRGGGLHRRARGPADGAGLCHPAYAAEGRPVLAGF